MQALYEGTWGWDGTKKRQELFEDPLSRYILVIAKQRRTQAKRIVGFAHFKFEFDDDGFGFFFFFPLRLYCLA